MPLDALGCTRVTLLVSMGDALCRCLLSGKSPASKGVGNPMKHLCMCLHFNVLTHEHSWDW